MLLSITTTHRPATDLGFLLHKNPARLHEFRLTFGKAFVFYPEAAESTCTAVLLLEVDPVGMVRGRPGAADGGLLDQYVNDRPYVASSFLSVAIAEAFRSAMGGRSKERPELAATPIPLKVRIPALPCRGGEPLLRRLFEPLGYAVTASRHPLDASFPEWGDGVYLGVDLERIGLVSEVLTHLYVLIPVLDGGKHYYIGDDEVRKLLERGKGWLRSHPEREAIARRYLSRRPSLARLALARLEDEDGVAAAAAAAGDGEEGESDGAEAAGEPEGPRAETECSLRLNDVRIGSVVSALRAIGASTVLDVGCGEGRLLGELLREPSLTRVVGMDVSVRALEIAARRLRLDRLPPRQRARIELLHGSLTYRDARLAGFDAATVVEVIEHLDPPRLAAFERVLFEFARPGTIVLTTPNREHNVVYERERAAREAVRVPSAGLAPATESAASEAPADPAAGTSGGRLRHPDHRFEWTRAEFREWAERTASRFAYSVSILPVGPEEPGLGAPTQMAVFRRNAAPEGRPG